MVHLSVNGQCDMKQSTNKLAQNIGNFINIALTLATRHQYWQCYKWQEGDLLDDEPEIGPGTKYVQCTIVYASVSYASSYV